ncbi:MAG: VWA domain-containing protein, partial [Anaerolineae bacterium]|nr:VWA domain-containing protein [Anaerolineae bacterium]
MKKALLIVVLVLVALIPVAAMQEAPAPRLEITGVNPTSLPTVVVTANVYDNLGQPVAGLTADNFRLTGPVADLGTITSVRQVEDANLPVAVVLVIDVSTSMDGRPFEQAKEAARAFVNTIRDNDPVAIFAFSTRVQLVQDYTTDKATLLAAIDALPIGGQTSLYEAAFVGVQKAAEAESPRRAVILLSDGAQYDESGPPRAARGDAASEAVVRGVPVYTIGLGYGTDRTFLIDLAQSTNARNYESPTPDQLEQIYRELAALLRSQYEIVITANVPADGTEYDLQLEVTTAQGTAANSAVLRAPIPVPIIRLPELSEPISEPTEIAATILADDGVSTVEIALDSQPATTLIAEPYSVVIDPVALAPGQHTLVFTAFDATGDSSSAALNFEVAPLPSVITLTTPLPDDELRERFASGLTITGQTPPMLVTAALD